MEKTVRYAELAEEKGYAKVMLVGSMPIDTSLEHVETGHQKKFSSNYWIKERLMQS
ncbi:MAG: hypothetical protein QMD78_00120 [Methanocellales archaeon]|nr:hypothetical protein [Methanocellales archaeon]